MPLAEPNNCWPFAVERFGDALADSAKFRELTNTADAVAAGNYIFGRKLTHTKSGHAWTREELESLRAYAQIFSDPAAPYGKRRTVFNSWEPFGSMIVQVGRLVTAQQLAAYKEIPDAMERDWQNIAGQIIDEMIEWMFNPPLTVTTGAPHITQVDVSEDGEQGIGQANTQGYWQFTETTWTWGLRNE
ncbi:MAG: hypothetical protein AB7G28_22770 [Pirellulales bacterium]